MLAIQISFVQFQLQMQAWGDQVSKQMELAGILSSEQHSPTTKSSNWKLQCLRQQPLTPLSPEIHRADPLKDNKALSNGGRRLQLRTWTASPSHPELPPSDEPRQPTRRSAKRLDKYYSKHQASHTSTMASPSLTTPLVCLLCHREPQCWCQILLLMYFQERHILKWQ